MSRRTRLSLVPLEDRMTPSTASYAAGTLTLTTGNNNVIDVYLKSFGNNNTIPGYLLVKAGNTAIFESADNQPVTNLIVKNGAGVEDYALEIFDNVGLANLTVAGATKMTNIYLKDAVQLTGNFTFTGNGAAVDNVTLEKGTIIGGNVAIDLKGGANTLYLQGASIGGNLTVTGGIHDDEVVFDDANVTIGGKAAFNLGDGHNQFHATKQNTLWVGKSLTYTGGTGDDNINFMMFNSGLRIGGGLNVTFGGSGASGNTWSSHVLDVGAGAVFTGGAGKDSVFFSGHSHIGNGIAFIGGNGENNLNVGGDSYQTIVGLGVKYTGGTGTDHARLNWLQTGKDVILNMGTGAVDKLVYLGNNQPRSIDIAGSLNITTAGGADDIRIYQTNVGKGMTVTAGGGLDKIYIDDTAVTGNTLIDLGVGDDELHVDTKALNDDDDPLDGITAFGGSFTVQAGDGADLVDLSDTGGQHVVVGGAIKLVGGIGQDTFKHYASGNLYLGIRAEDFELGETF